MPLPTWRICSPKPPSWASNLRQRRPIVFGDRCAVDQEETLARQRFRAGRCRIDRAEQITEQLCATDAGIDQRLAHGLLDGLPEAEPGPALFLDLGLDVGQSLVVRALHSG